VTDPVQTVTIAADALAFTAVCEICVGIDTAVGLSASTFAGRLDLDLAEAVFLCRRGHHVGVIRAAAAAGSAAAAA
jgi:hypothetical protein